MFVCLFGFLLLVFQIPVKESEEGVKIKYPHIIKKKKKKEDSSQLVIGYKYPWMEVASMINMTIGLTLVRM